MYPHAVFCGRFNPLHRGHEAVIHSMRRDFLDKDITIAIGSTNVERSLRNPFLFEERKEFFDIVFPTLAVIALPDYTTDHEWLAALDAALLKKSITPEACVFFAGSEVDVPFFLHAGRPVRIVDRHSGATPLISATVVRDTLRAGKPINNMVHPEVEKLIRKKYALS